MSSINPELVLTLDDAVGEVLGELYGLDLAYDPAYDRYRTIARMINRALRANALEHEWSYYASLESIGTSATGDRAFDLRSTIRPRIINDDSVRLVDEDGVPRFWAYFLPRDALHKYSDRGGLWCSVTRTTLTFSRAFTAAEAGLDVQVPVMREPHMFTIPAQPEVPADPLVVFDADVRTQPVDFAYPDIIVARATYMYSLTDPVTQPRAQTLEALYKDLMYQAIERDDRNTDTPYQNDFVVPVQNSIYPEATYSPHPLADERR